MGRDEQRVRDPLRRADGTRVGDQPVQNADGSVTYSNGGPMREPDDDLKFDGSSGRKPSAEARRYIYRVLATALETDMRDHEGWMREGITNDFDLRRLRKAAKLVVAELIRKGRR